MKLPWKQEADGTWSGKSCEYPHLGLVGRIRPGSGHRTWNWEIRAITSHGNIPFDDGHIAGHWKNGRLISECVGRARTVEAAMAAAEEAMDEACV